MTRDGLRGDRIKRGPARELQLSERIFIGVAWPYANGPLHLGHVAGCYLAADIFARYHRMAGNEVLMVSGSDTHGTPITIITSLLRFAGISQIKLISLTT